MPDGDAAVVKPDIPSYEAFLEKHKELLKTIVIKYHRRLSRSYSDSYYDDIYQEALIALWNLYKKIYLFGEFEHYELFEPEIERGIIGKRLNWSLSTYVAQLRGGSLYEKNRLFRNYNLALYFDAFNTMTDEEIKKRFCDGSDLTLLRLKQMAVYRKVHSLDEPFSEDAVFGDTVEDLSHFNEEKILSLIIEKDFISLLNKEQRDICELMTAGFSTEEIAAALSLHKLDCKEKIRNIYKFAVYYGFSRRLKKIYSVQPSKPLINSVSQFEEWLSVDEKLVNNVVRLQLFRI